MPPLDPGAAFALLGLAEEATEREVRRAYRRLARAWHPDVHGLDAARKAEAEERMKGLNAAYALAREAARTRSTAPQRRAPPAAPTPSSRPARPRPGGTPSPAREPEGPERRRSPRRRGVEAGLAGRLADAAALLRRAVALLPGWAVLLFLLLAVLVALFLGR